MGIRAMAQAIEARLRGAGSHQLRRPVAVAQQQSARAPSSCRSTTRSYAAVPSSTRGAECATSSRRSPQDADVPIYVYGETKTSQHLPNEIWGNARLHPHVRGHAGVHGPPHHPGGSAYLEGNQPPFSRRCSIRGGRLYSARPGNPAGSPSQEPGGPDVPPVLRGTCCAPTLQRGRRARPAVDHTARWRPPCATRRATSTPTTASCHQRHQHSTDGVAPRGGAGDVVVVGPQCHSRSCTRSS